MGVEYFVIDAGWFQTKLDPNISDDWEARYEEYIEKLENAGVQDVLDELASQYNEYKK